MEKEANGADEDGESLENGSEDEGYRGSTKSIADDSASCGNEVVERGANGGQDVEVFEEFHLLEFFVEGDSEE